MKTMSNKDERYVVCAVCADDSCHHIDPEADSVPSGDDESNEVTAYHVAVENARWYEFVVLARNREEAKQFALGEAMGTFVMWNEPYSADTWAYVMEEDSPEPRRGIADVQTGERL